MENIEVTIRFGVGNGVVRSFAAGTTIGQAVNDVAVKAALGHPANVRALIGRVPQDNNSRLQNGDVVDLETVGTSKAS